jgi:polysaccharide deacetylase family sporulation protein PdaB
MKTRTWLSFALICSLSLLLIGPVSATAPATEDVIRDVPTTQKLIALTFDDGPNPVYTPQVLDLLHKYHAKATFFVIGSKVTQHADLVKRESAEGHEVANHSYRHRLKRITGNDLYEDLAKAQEAIYSATGHEAHLYRPPGGMYNRSIVNTAKEAGYRVVLWSSDPHDWREPGVHRIVQSVKSHLHNGDIVLLHDHGRHCPQTLKALEQLLPELEAAGYQFVTISELLQKSNKLPAHLPTP